MTTEDGRQNGEGDRDEQKSSLIIRSEQMPLAQAAENPFLLQVGFSQELFIRLARLNEIMKKRDNGVSSAGLEMMPGEIPLITTNLTHNNVDYRVIL